MNRKSIIGLVLCILVYGGIYRFAHQFFWWLVALLGVAAVMILIAKLLPRR